MKKNDRKKRNEKKERIKNEKKTNAVKIQVGFHVQFILPVHVITKLCCSCIMNILLPFVIGSDGASKLETSPHAGPDPVRIKVRKQFKDALAAR